jgi:hypothetical protein
LQRAAVPLMAPDLVRASRFHQHVRLSFGPPMAEVERGLDRLEEMVGSAAPTPISRSR